MSAPQLTLEQALAKAAHLRDIGEIAKAEHWYRQVLGVHDRQVDAMLGLSGIAFDAGRFGDALPMAERATQLRPSSVDAVRHCAKVLVALDRRDDAAALLQGWLERKPDHPEVMRDLAGLYAALKRPGKARTLYKALVQLDGSDVDSLYGFAQANWELGYVKPALLTFERAGALRPDLAAPYFGVACCRHALGDLPGAEAAYRAALRAEPDSIGALANLGNVLRDLDRIDEAEAAYRQVIAQAPAFAPARYNLGWLQLLQGQMDEGWANYRCRKSLALAPRAPIDSPCWQGEPLAGKRVLVVREQGFGDQIQFVRYLAPLRAAGAEVDVLASEALAPLFAGLPGVGHVNPPLDGAHYDYWVPMLDLPAYLDAPAAAPYLRADPDKVAQWQIKLGPGVKVGLVWAGSATHANDRFRSIAPEAMASLTSVPGVRFFSLQKGAAELESTSPLQVRQLGKELNDFSDTAAVIANLDLLISVDTAPVHLAGAMGVPVWTLLPKNPDWRWLRQGEGSAWYPSMRLYRQDTLGEWGQVVDRLARDLPAFVMGRHGRGA